MIRAALIGILAAAGAVALALAQPLPNNPLATQSGPPLNGCGTLGAHLCGNGASPAVSSCGTGPILEGTDTTGVVQTGTGATACTLTFATPWAAPPKCIVHGDANSPSITRSATVLTLTAALASTAYTYICFGRPGGG